MSFGVTEPMAVEAKEINIELTPEQLEQLQQEFDGLDKTNEVELTGEMKENIDKEFKALEDESIVYVAELERLRAEAKRSKIWGGVIIALIAAIFGVGIVSVVRENKQDKQKKEGENEKAGKAKA